jgi:hypothetical protein
MPKFRPEGSAALLFALLPDDQRRELRQSLTSTQMPYMFWKSALPERQSKDRLIPSVSLKEARHRAASSQPLAALRK